MALQWSIETNTKIASPEYPLKGIQWSVDIKTSIGNEPKKENPPQILLKPVAVQCISRQTQVHPQMLLATQVADSSQNAVVGSIPSAPSLPQNEVVESTGGIFHRGFKRIKDLYTSIMYGNNAQQILPANNPQPIESTQVSTQSSQPTETQQVSAQPTQPIETQEISREAQQVSTQPNHSQAKEPQSNAQQQQVPQQIQPRPYYIPDNWEQNNIFKISSKTVRAGYEMLGEKLYVARVSYDGNYIPAKALQFSKLAYYPHNGIANLSVTFEYLVGDRYKWVNGMPFPRGAVIVNPSSTKEHLYIGRCKYLNALICGKFVRSENRLYIPFGLFEISVTEDFEILVHEDRALE